MEVNQTFKLQIIKRLYKSDNTDISNVITINHMSFPDKLFNNGLIRLILNGRSVIAWTTFYKFILIQLLPILTFFPNRLTGLICGNISLFLRVSSHKK